MTEGARVSIDTGASVLPEAIYTDLRRRIINQSFAPGASITESAVALEFAVARPTAKMAIERLVSDGLLRRELHQSARVPQLDATDIADLFDNRAVVEAAAAGSLAGSRVVPLQAMRAHRDLVAGIPGNQPFAESDIAFHRALVAGQASPRLTRMHAMLMGEIELCIGQVQAGHLIDVKDVAVQHQAILDAIGAGDSALASSRMREHILAARDALIDHYESSTPS